MKPPPMESATAPHPTRQASPGARKHPQHTTIKNKITLIYTKCYFRCKNTYKVELLYTLQTSGNRLFKGINLYLQTKQQRN